MYHELLLVQIAVCDWTYGDTCIHSLVLKSMQRATLNECICICLCKPLIKSVIINSSETS